MMEGGGTTFVASTAMRACVRGRSFVRRGGDGLVDRRRPELVEALTRREISDLKRKKRKKMKHGV